MIKEIYEFFSIKKSDVYNPETYMSPQDLEKMNEDLKCLSPSSGIIHKPGCAPCSGILLRFNSEKHKVQREEFLKSTSEHFKKYR